MSKNKKVFISSRFAALKIVSKPAKTWRDKHGNPKKSESEFVQFEDYKLETDDPKKIAIVEKYMEDHPNEITVVDPKEIEKQERIRKKAAELVEEEMEKEAKEKENTAADKFGKDNDAEDKVPGEYTEKEIDEADIQNANPADMNKKQLLKYAKENDIKLDRKTRKDTDLIRRICLDHFNNPEESGDQNLNDESGTE